MIGETLSHMPRHRIHPADHVHYTAGFTGTLKWMGYWARSRSKNAGRALRRHWRFRLRPTLAQQSAAVKTRVETALHRSAESEPSRSYESLADAVRQRQWMDAHG